MMMRFVQSAVIAIALAPGVFGASREIVELQRQMVQIEEQMKRLQTDFEERLTKLTALVEQGVQSSNKTNTSLTGMESGLRDRLGQQLTAPMTAVSTKVDQMSTEFQSLRESVSDMNERMSKLQTQIVEVGNTVKTLQAPPPPPPTAVGVPGAPGTAPPAGLSPNQLYESAMRDRSSGNFDLARQGFEEYLKWFGDTELAPNAQFYIGQIYYDKNEFPNAIKAFDTVLERYGDTNKSADAMYMKGMALLKSSQRNQAAQEFLSVIQKYPNAEVATKARAQRKALGLSVPGTTPPATRRRTARG